PQTRFLWLAMHSHAERGNEVPGGFCDSLLRGKDGGSTFCDTLGGGDPLLAMDFRLRGNDGSGINQY
nr:hypothetical protein [Endozoicomonas sp.]